MKYKKNEQYLSNVYCLNGWIICQYLPVDIPAYIVYIHMGLWPSGMLFKSYWPLVGPIKTLGSFSAAATKSQGAHSCYSSDVCGHSTTSKTVCS